MSARAMLEALIAGQRDVEVRADLARGRRGPRGTNARKPERGALRRIIALTDRTLAYAGVLGRGHGARQWGNRPAPGGGPRGGCPPGYPPGCRSTGGEILMAEIGTDMHRFPSATPLASGPGCAQELREWRETAERQDAPRPSMAAAGARRNRPCRVQNATPLSGSTIPADCGTTGQKTRLDRGGAYHLDDRVDVVERQQPFQALGAAYFDQREPHRVERRLVQRLERLGYAVSLQPRALVR